MTRRRVSSLFAHRQQRFEAAVRPHLDRLYRYSQQLTRDPALAEDLVQTLLLKLYQREVRLDTLEKAGPWLARALHNLYVDQVRKHTRTPLDMADTDDDLLCGWPTDTASCPEALTDRSFERDRLQAALGQLNPEHRAVVAWHDIEGYSLEELARDGDVALGTLKSRLHRARANLRRILMEPTSVQARVRGGD
ncbi:RNA polymerase sigma factor [Algiphilus sp.]|uniref:RNA polymerase sigma factor n=1 Tax=Algiphilus sp. TaxID=1872431 RepID=UPI003B52B2B1